MFTIKAKAEGGSTKMTSANSKMKDGKNVVTRTRGTASSPTVIRNRITTYSNGKNRGTPSGLVN